ncbi:MAG TPA: hypothetical protein VLG37_04470 [Candidatus Saccharimonadales bacterium]|nr:hypothetical protein [Candidatus Saccharimonadales bacterium]
MNKTIKKLENWHQTKLGLLVFALLELAIAYGFGSLAIDRGSFGWFLLTLIFLIGSLQNFIKLILAISKWRRAMH